MFSRCFNSLPEPLRFSADEARVGRHFNATSCESCRLLSSIFKCWFLLLDLFNMRYDLGALIFHVFSFGLPMNATQLNKIQLSSEVSVSEPEIQPLIPPVCRRPQILRLPVFRHTIPDPLPSQINHHIKDLCANEHANVVSDDAKQDFVTGVVIRFVGFPIDLLGWC